MIKKYKMLGGQPYPVSFKHYALKASEDEGIQERGFIELPQIITPDIIAFEARYVQSGPNLNKAYFDQVELMKAYHSVPMKAIDVEHNVEDVVGHIYASKFVDRDKGKELILEDIHNLSEEELRKLNIDVMIGGVVYADRFPMLEGPVGDKSYKISMEVFLQSFDILMENGTRITLEEAQALGWNDLVEQLLSDYTIPEELEAAHRVNVILPNKETAAMNVYKWLLDLTFSGAGIVLNPACPACKILSTSSEECNVCTDKEAESSVEQAEVKEPITLDLTKVESFMKDWRRSREGKPLNIQVKEDVKPEEKAEDLPSIHPAPPFVKDRDPNAETKSPATCPQYKYELWVIQGAGEDRKEEMLRHWCTYSNEKCPTAGDRTWHECNRWYQRGEDWIEDLRNFRDDNNPFNMERTEEGDEITVEAKIIDDLDEHNIDYKRMHSMIDSFMYKFESVCIEPEKKRRG